MVEHDVAVPLVADGQDKLLERNVLDDLERPDAEALVPVPQRRVQVIDPVTDVMQPRQRSLILRK